MNNEAKQILAESKADLAERQSLANVKQQRRNDLTGAISKLTAVQQLDGTDHAQRIAAARAEVAEIEAWQATWPDVRAELERRIVAAEESVKLEEQENRVDRLSSAMAAEVALRAAYALKNWEFQELCFQLRRVLQLKEGIAMESFDAGTPIRHLIGDTQMPPFSRIIGTPEAVESAKRLLEEWNENGQLTG